MEKGLVKTKGLYSKCGRALIGVLFLVCAGQIVSASSRQLPTLVDESASATNTQSDSSQAGAEQLRTHRLPRSNTPHSVEIAVAPTINQISYEPQLVHQLTVETVEAFQLANLTDQRADDHRELSSYSSVIVSYSSGRSPPRQG